MDDVDDQMNWFSQHEQIHNRITHIHISSVNTSTDFLIELYVKFPSDALVIHSHQY
jgi:hypothetical protein